MLNIESTPIVLDKARNLVFDLNAMSEFERVTGRNLLQENIWLNITASETRAFLWACLLAESPTITLEEVGALVWNENMLDITKTLMKAYNLGTPKKGDQGDGQGTGKKKATQD